MLVCKVGRCRSGRGRSKEEKEGEELRKAEGWGVRSDKNVFLHEGGRGVIESKEERKREGVRGRGR